MGRFATGSSLNCSVPVYGNGRRARRSMRKLWRHLLVLCAISPLCAVNPVLPMGLAQTLKVPDAGRYVPPATPVPADNTPAPAPESYQLQTGDTISLVYRLTPEYNQTASLQPDGTVTLQLLGSIAVQGLTLAQARTRIQDAAAKRLRSPELSLQLDSWEGPHFTVLGQVGTPGRFSLRGPLTVVDGLAMAGGLTLSAKHTNIVLIHRVSETVGETRLVDYRALEQQHKPGTELISLQPGDIIYVPLSKLTKVERYVHLANFGLSSGIPL